jgi:hypothetical protein
VNIFLKKLRKVCKNKGNEGVQRIIRREGEGKRDGGGGGGRGGSGWGGEGGGGGMNVGSRKWDEGLS